ncbi:hypothetical protein Tco_0253809 [Tanacetum coccineum]
MKYNEKTGVYSCQQFRKALAITPVILAHPFELPPSGNIVIDFFNELGYPEPVEIVSNIRVNYVYQPWRVRAILTLINQCLTGKTSGSDKPRHPVLLFFKKFTQFCKCCGESSLKLMLIMQSCYGKSLLKGSRNFSHTKQVTNQSEEPKEESDSSPHPLWTVFQSDNLLLGK